MFNRDRATSALIFKLQINRRYLIQLPSSRGFIYYFRQGEVSLSLSLSISFFLSFFFSFFSETNSVQKSPRKRFDSKPRVRVEFDETREANCQTIVAETSGGTARARARRIFKRKEREKSRRGAPERQGNPMKSRSKQAGFAVSVSPPSPSNPPLAPLSFRAHP